MQEPNGISSACVHLNRSIWWPSPFLCIRSFVSCNNLNQSWELESLKLLIFFKQWLCIPLPSGRKEHQLLRQGWGGGRHGMQAGLGVRNTGIQKHWDSETLGFRQGWDSDRAGMRFRQDRDGIQAGLGFRQDIVPQSAP